MTELKTLKEIRYRIDKLEEKLSKIHDAAMDASECLVDLENLISKKEKDNAKNEKE